MFLKQKVDKKIDVYAVKALTKLIDVDQDNYITEHDITTCVKNLQNATFWRQSISGADTAITEQFKIALS